MTLITKMLGTPDVTEIIDKGITALDDNVLSAEERETLVSERHATDMASDNWMAKSIRPIIALVMLAIWLLVHVVVLFKFMKVEVDMNDLIFADSAILIAVIGFYFNSRKAEKIMDKQVGLQRVKVKAAIEMKEKELKHTKVQERREMRQLKRENRK